MTSIVAGEGKGAILNALEDHEYATAIECMYNVCSSLKKRGRIFAAQKIAQTGQRLAHQRYTKGQAGYNKFDEFLSD